MGTKKQTNLRLAEETLSAAKQAAKARGINLNDYVEQLITEDTTGARGRGMAAAQQLIDRFGDFLDGLEDEYDHRRAADAKDTAA